jgi:Aminoglycoside-2''-adenylyltransferase
VDDAADGRYSRAPEVEDLVAVCRALNRVGARYVLIGGFAVILHGFVRATKDIDLLVDSSEANVQALKEALAVLPDNAAALLADDEVQRYPVVRIADEIIVDLMAAACGIGYDEAVATGVEKLTVEGVTLPVASKQLLIRTKETVRESDHLDVRFLRLRIEEDQARGK